MRASLGPWYLFGQAGQNGAGSELTEGLWGDLGSTW